jgi:hypothetical protein
LPLCGAAVTFFAAAKKVTKESSRSARSMLEWPHVTRGEWISLSVSSSVKKGLWHVLGCPPRAFIDFGSASFRSGLALRARTKGSSGQTRAQQLIGVGERWHVPAGRLRFATPSVMPGVGHAVQDG